MSVEGTLASLRLWHISLVFYVPCINFIIYLLAYLLTCFVCIVTESNYGSCFIACCRNGWKCFVTCCRNGWKALTTGWRSFYSVNHWPTTKSSWSCTVRSLCSMCIASFIRTLTADCAHSQSTCSLRTWLASWLRTHHFPRITSVMWKLEDRMSASLDEFKESQMFSKVIQICLIQDVVNE